MKWQGRQGSSNVEDRRRQRNVRAAGGIGIGTIILALIVTFMGGDPQDVLQQAQNSQPPTTQTQTSAASDELAQFVSVVLKETEDVWNNLFAEHGQQYHEPVLVLFTEKVSSACGYASAATGPFYCPGDHKLYIDLSFYNQLKNRFNAPGDFALAYVVAHEVGHHVQNLLGYTDYVHKQRRVLPKAEYNQLSVRLELMADFLAGVWAHHAQRTKGILEEGDIEEALTAAHAIGDDNIQKKSRGYVVPDSFTHGTSEQRMRWFMKGYKTGDINQGNTFEAVNL